MQIRAGERLHLTLWGAGGRAMVSLNTYPVTQPALEGVDPAEDGFTYDVTSWLHDGFNTLTVVLIGSAGDAPFRMTITQEGQLERSLDEADFLPMTTPWRLWTQRIEREAPVSIYAAVVPQPRIEPVADAQITPGPAGLGMPLRSDQIRAPVSLVSIAMPDQPCSVVSTINIA